MATIVKRTYLQQPDPEAVKKLAQVILKIGTRILNEERSKAAKVCEEVG